MITVKSKIKNYNIYVEKNSLLNINDYLDLKKFSNILILTDENIIKYGWLNKLKKYLNVDNYISIEPGEINKSIDSILKIWKEMNKFNMDRKSLLINFGGGVICDIGGFCASTYMRSIEFLQIPTTLLSQVDASVGGKTGFDFNNIKNLIGTFAIPYSVIIDSNILKTLPKREYISGFGEIIKYGIIYDKKFFEYLEKNTIKTIDIDYIIKKSCEIKAKIVSNDFNESSLRKILNFGHTIGHSIETLSLQTNNPLLHGEAVAIGMIAESFIANKINYISIDEFNKIKNLIKKYNLPINCKISNLENIYSILFKDKKNIKKIIKWVLPNKIGKYTYDIEVNENIIKEAIKYILE